MPGISWRAPATCTVVVADPGDGFYDGSGFVRSWLIHDPIPQAGGCAPDPEDRLALTLAKETTVLPRSGDAGWRVHHSLQDTIDHNTVFGGYPDEHVVYHVAYLWNESGVVFPAVCAVASDDSVVVKLGQYGAAHCGGMPWLRQSLDDSGPRSVHPAFRRAPSDGQGV